MIFAAVSERAGGFHPLTALSVAFSATRGPQGDERSLRMPPRIGR